MPYTNPFSQEGADHPALQPWMRAILMGLPYVGPAYSAARLGGAIYRGISGLNHGATSYPDPGAPQEGAAPTTAGGADPTDPNNPANYTLGNRPTGAPTYRPGGISPYDAYNASRAPNAITAQQFQFPGSAIGPLAYSTNPYSAAGTGYQTRGDRGLGAAPAGSIQGIPGYASAAYGEILKRNQL